MKTLEELLFDLASHHPAFTYVLTLDGNGLTVGAKKERGKYWLGDYKRFTWEQVLDSENLILNASEQIIKEIKEVPDAET